MPRYQKVKPDFEPEHLKLVKKRARICKMAQIAWAALMVAGILVIAIGGSHKRLIGVCSFVMSALSFALAILFCYAMYKKWAFPTLLGGFPADRATRAERAREASDNHTFAMIMTVGFFAIGAVLAAVGALYWCGVL